VCLQVGGKSEMEFGCMLAGEDDSFDWKVMKRDETV
jgi:hypothetical protein